MQTVKTLPTDPEDVGHPPDLGVFCNRSLDLESYCSQYKPEFQFTEFT